MGQMQLVKGADASLVGTAVRELVERLVGDGDRSLLVEDVDLGADGVLDVALDAAVTPPFLTDRRIVVIRSIDALDAASVPSLVSYVQAPSDFTDLVLTQVGGRLPKALADAWKAGGGLTIDADPGMGKARQGWVDEQLAAADVQLDHTARAAIVDSLGEDLGQLDALLDLLASTFGAQHKLTAAEVQPYLGEGGGVPPWELTDAIDRGDAGAALVAVRRMTSGGGRHPLQIMATLMSHAERMLRLDGTDAGSEQAAAEILGMKVDGRGKSYPAKKALDASRRLGSEGIRRAIELLARADRDLRGESGLPDGQVIEVLVARLARLSPRR
jgi:DNA polymerase III subunit delta